jgi:hypothetical protein
LLIENCAEIDDRVAKCQSAMAAFESRGRHNDVRRCRQLIRAQEHERRGIERMIAALHRRFQHRGSGAVVAGLHQRTETPVSSRLGTAIRPNRW